MFLPASLVLVLTFAASLHSPAQGLLFYGKEKDIAERSSYRVFTERLQPDFSKETDIRFEYAVQNIESTGYILLLKDEKTKKAYNLTFLFGFGENNRFIFSKDGEKACYSAAYSTQELKSRRWLPIALRLLPAEDKAEIKIGNNQAVLSNIGLKGERFSPTLYFGMHDYILETASFAVRNLTVSNGKNTWHMPLDEYAGQTVHDDSGKATGHVENPTWLISQSYHWKNVLTYYSSTPTGVAFDKTKQHFYIYNTDSLLTYDTYTGHLQAKAYKNGPYFAGKRSLGMNFLDADNGKLYAYELAEANDVSCLSLHDTTWTPLSKDPYPRCICLHHHCGFYHPERKEFLLFGGYGYRRYSNTFMTYHADQMYWDTLHVEGDRIPPRFFAGIAVSTDLKRAYIYGGKGNDAGLQDIGVQYYYDLYRVDLDARTVTKLWEQEPPTTNRVVARDMLLDADESHIYFLGYPEYLPHTHVQLYRMETNDGKLQALGDSIPFISEEIATNVNLYRNEPGGELYCCIQEYAKYGETKVSIYSLQMPPVDLAAITRYNGEARRTMRTWIIAMGTAGMLLAVLCLWLAARRRKAKHHGNNASGPETETAKEEEGQTAMPEIHFKDRNAVYLFGTFSVLDRKGKDISYMFSPKLRLIFLYLLLHSTKGNIGVLSADMNAIFWPDKAADKVKNLKGVTLNHIRKILQELEGIELVNDKGYFKLILDESCYCDYLAFWKSAASGPDGSMRQETADRLLKTGLRGKFLAGIEHELLDSYKHEVEETILSTALKEADKADKAGLCASALQWSRLLALADPLSEQSLYYDISAYRKMGKPEEALRRYNTFANRYKKEMGEDYTTRYEAFLNGDINRITH